MNLVLTRADGKIINADLDSQGVLIEFAAPARLNAKGMTAGESDVEVRANDIITIQLVNFDKQNG